MSEAQFIAARNGNLSELASLITANNINDRSHDGYSLLHDAIAFRHDSVANWLIEHGIDVNISDNEGKTALSYAATYQNHEIADQLIKAGANLNAVDRFGNIPLWNALQSSRKDYMLFGFLLKVGADPGIKNKAGRSVVDFATQTNNEHLLEVIKKYGRGS